MSVYLDTTTLSLGCQESLTLEKPAELHCAKDELLEHLLREQAQGSKASVMRRHNHPSPHGLQFHDGSPHLLRCGAAKVNPADDCSDITHTRVAPRVLPPTPGHTARSRY